MKRRVDSFVGSMAGWSLICFGGFQLWLIIFFPFWLGWALFGGRWAGCEEEK